MVKELTLCCSRAFRRSRGRMAACTPREDGNGSADIHSTGRGGNRKAASIKRGCTARSSTGTPPRMREESIRQSAEQSSAQARCERSIVYFDGRFSWRATSLCAIISHDAILRKIFPLNSACFSSNSPPPDRGGEKSAIPVRVPGGGPDGSPAGGGAEQQVSVPTSSHGRAGNISDAAGEARTTRLPRERTA